MRFLPLILSACILAACGGGGGANSSTSSLSSTQAAYESLMLNPGAIYQATSSLPLSGQPVSGTHYLYDASQSLSKSPLSNGVQRLSSGASTTIATSLSLPSSPAYSRWYIVSGAVVKAPDPMVFDVKYQGNDVLTSFLSQGGDKVLYSNTSTLISATNLTGAVASAADLNSGIPKALFTNTNLLKSGATWSAGAAYLTYAWKNNADSYMVYSDPIDSGELKPIATATTIDALKASGKLSFSGDYPAVVYGSANGATKDVDGVTTYIANSPFFGDTVSGYYRTFYYLNGNVYAGQMSKSGAVTVNAGYNTQARESLKAALTF